ncbi:MAG: hypothetical protein HY985_10720 [Magnetospirillum sp.]|nr:hypothetical protein [Magnetospirillum sp.]
MLSDAAEDGQFLRATLMQPSILSDFLAIDGDMLIYRWGRKLHPTVLPVAVTVGAWVDPPMAQQVYQHLKLPQMLARVPSMDLAERRTIAALAGIASSGYRNAGAFDPIVIRQADRLVNCFTVDPALPPTRYAVRPRELPRKQWNSLSAPDKVMAATLIGLYSGDGGRHLMPGLRLPGAVDAVTTMLEGPPDLQKDFLSLIAFYAGW